LIYDLYNRTNQRACSTNRSKIQVESFMVFGSYARGEATEESDVDFLMDETDSSIVNIFDLYDINTELAEVMKTKIDLISTYGLFSPIKQKQFPNFVKAVSKERVLIYEK
jgi:predicted nucleotidyltransferase